MIIEFAETVITTGNGGSGCPYDGEHIDEKGNIIECRCDECDYYLKCFPDWEKSF